MSYGRDALLRGALGISSLVLAGVGAITAGVAALYATPAGAVTSVMSPIQPTLHTMKTQVDGKTETILVNAQGLPLYYFKGDTATKSRVSGVLAKV